MDVKLSANGVFTYLKEMGIPEEFCKVFEDNYIDGCGCVMLKKEEVRKLVPPIGIAKKIFSLVPKEAPPIDRDLREKLRQMDITALSTYLFDEGFPSQYCDTFEDNFIDGEALFDLSEEEVCEMLPPVGLAKKIMYLIRPEKSRSVDESLSPQLQTSTCVIPSPPSSAGDQLSVSRGTSSIVDPGSTHGHRDIIIPDHWRPEVEECLKKKILTPNARQEMVRTIASQLFARHSRPDRSDCEKVARQIILKYPFTKDDMGCGYRSWTEKLVERVRNVIKTDYRKVRRSGDAVSVPPSKRSKKDPSIELLRRYPVSASNLNIEDPASVQLHLKGIEEEMKRAKPRDTVLLPLLRTTFGERRLFVLNDASSIKEIRECYPALTVPAVFEQEFGLILGRSNAKQDFTSEWCTKYAPAIISYGEKSTKRAIREILQRLNSADEVSKQKVALQILGKCFAMRSGKDYLSYLFQEYDETSSMDGILSEEYAAPRVALISSSSKLQYFVVAEKQVLGEYPCLQDALFFCFAAYYVYHLEYPSQVKNMFYFFQDFVVKHPDSYNRSGTYLATTSDIKRNI